MTGQESHGKFKPLLELKNIQKWFGGVHALRGIDLVLEAGEVYHLLGENGCGKSTVIKIMSGVLAPSAGEIVLDGHTYSALTPIQSLASGIETVYQDLSLLPNLTVAENVALTEQLVDSSGRLVRLFNRRRLFETATQALAAVGLPTNRTFLETNVSDLPLASRQLVAIARAIATRAKLVIMDEPTTSLTRREVDNLVEVVARLRSQSVAVLFVTHKLDECYRIGGRAIVFRDGICVSHGPISNYSKEHLAELMTGRSIDATRYRAGRPSHEELLRVEGLRAEGVLDVSLTLRRGEILGITGLADSGRNELAMALAGVAPANSGVVNIAGNSTVVRSPAEAKKLGIGYVPEDRLAEGLFLDKSILENEITLVVDRLTNVLGIIDRDEARKIAARLTEDMRLNTKDLDLPVGSLSGGNQQRVLIGRWLSIRPKVLVLHGPTVGVDVGSKDTIYRVMQSISEMGMGIIIVSDDLPELLQNADRILVMNGGRVVAETIAAETTEDHIYKTMLGNASEDFEKNASPVESPGVMAPLRRASVGTLVKHNPEIITLLLLVAICIAVAISNTEFLQPSTLIDLGRDSVVMGLFALGVLVILAAGGIDVSFTAIAAFTMYSMTLLVQHLLPGLPILIILLMATVGGAVLGVINGLLVHKLRVPSLIVTIGTQYLYRGFLLSFIGTVWIMELPKQMAFFGKDPLFRFVSSNGAIVTTPLYFLVLPSAALLTWWILNRTLMGRAIFAVGGNTDIARRLGYNLRNVHLFLFGYAGALAGLAGIIHVCANRQANPFALVGTEINVIAAVVLGGARITGGTGTVMGTLLGVMLIVTVNSVLVLVGIPSTWQRLVVGAFILLAAAFFATHEREK